MKNNMIRFFGFLCLTAAAVVSFSIPKHNKKNCKNDVENYTLIQSGESLLKDYYNDVIEANKGKEVCTFEDFCSEYRKGDLDIKTFTKVACDNPMLREDQTTSKIEIKNSSSGDENYIIGKNKDYKNGIPKSAFKRMPIYRNYYDYEYRRCDVIYETFTFVGEIGHAACVVSSWEYTNETNIDDRIPYVKTVEAVGSGVNYGFLDDERMCKFGILIYRSNTSLKMKQKDNIENFLHSQIGKPYLLAGGYSSSANKANWMCSTLVEAAYEAGNVKLFDNPHYVRPDELVTSSKLSLVQPLTSEFIEYVSVTVKYDFLLFGKHYDVKLYNPTTSTRTVEYTSKTIAIGNRLSSWNSGYDTKTVNISSKSTVTVRVNPGSSGTTGATIMDFACRYTNYSRYTSEGYKVVDFISVYRMLSNHSLGVYKEH